MKTLMLAGAMVAFAIPAFAQSSSAIAVPNSEWYGTIDTGSTIKGPTPLSIGIDPKDGAQETISVGEGSHIDFPGGGRIDGPVTITVYGKAKLDIDGK
jgi:hypothetical protein